MQLKDRECAKVVLAEDSLDDEALALRALRQTDVPLAVQVAHDGDRALELLGLRHVTDVPSLPKLIMLDIKMPKVGGVEVLRRVRQESRFEHVPVVMLTSSDEPVDIELCKTLGANGYVKKPVDFTEFLDTITEVAQYWLADRNGHTEMPSCLFSLAELN
jgi:two-component system response regulator